MNTLRWALLLGTEVIFWSGLITFFALRYGLKRPDLSRGVLVFVIGEHVALLAFGTAEQKDHYLPRMATGEIRTTMALTEPGGGSDLRAITTVAGKSDDHCERHQDLDHQFPSLLASILHGVVGSCWVGF